MRKKALITTALKPAPLVDDSGNVLKFPERVDETPEMERVPTGMELRCARVLYEAHTGDIWEELAEGSDEYWVYVKTARAMIQEMRTLSFDIVQKVRGKPFTNAKDIWETIIDECSP